MDIDVSNISKLSLSITPALISLKEATLTQQYKGRNIYIYGAGHNAKLLYAIFHQMGIKTDGFVVTNTERNQHSLFYLPVYGVDEFKRFDNTATIVSAQWGNNNYSDIFTAISNAELKNVYYLPRDFYEDIFYKRQRHDKYIAELQKYCMGSEYMFEHNCLAEPKHEVFVLKQDISAFRWRIHIDVLRRDVDNFAVTFGKKSAIDEFVEQYGEYITFGKHEEFTSIEVKTKINVYVVCHHNNKTINNETLQPWLILLQAGAKYAPKRICAFGDDSGDNISERNIIYSEGTAIYWMWKNAPVCDYIGVFHYRRQMDLTSSDIEFLNKDNIDVLVTLPTFIPNGIYSFFKVLVTETDIEVFLSSVRNVAADYFEDAKKFFKSRFYPPCNIFVMRDKIFREYAAFLFSVTFEIESFYNKSNINRNDRYMGYLVEALMGIFLMHNKNKYKISYTDMHFYREM